MHKTTLNVLSDKSVGYWYWSDYCTVWFCYTARRYDFGRKGVTEGASGYMYDGEYGDEYSYGYGQEEYKFTGFGGVRYEG